jgi:hypothetical protein
MKKVTKFEFDLVFALPAGDFDAFELSDAVYGAGFSDAVVGTGKKGLVAITIETEGENAEGAILSAAQAILPNLPQGTTLREIRPDLVSLEDVASRLNVKRQALQQRTMPLPACGGYYRVTEVANCLRVEVSRAQRRPRFDLAVVEPWFAAGRGAQRLNALLALGALDSASLEIREFEDVIPHPAVLGERVG